MIPSRTATFIGLGAVALWSLLALLTTGSGAVPPFQLAAMGFGIGGGLGALSWLWRPAAMSALRQGPVVWAVGIGGLFGYHALYFAALRLAPPADANLINYLWPLLIVLLSATLPGMRLRANHALGAAFGFAGVVALIAAGGGLSADADNAAGYACALAAAFVWAVYSILSRRLGTVPTDAVAGFCLASALLSVLCHLAFERTIWPADALQWIAVGLTGLGPLGIAFYLWDIGVKRGDIRLLGVASYAIPLLSTVFLIAAGYARATPALGLSCALIVAGAVMAGLERKRR